VKKPPCCSCAMADREICRRNNTCCRRSVNAGKGTGGWRRMPDWIRKVCKPSLHAAHYDASAVLYALIEYSQRSTDMLWWALQCAAIREWNVPLTSLTFPKCSCSWRQHVVIARPWRRRREWLTLKLTRQRPC
jgi:hypothetical protein